MQVIRTEPRKAPSRSFIRAPEPVRIGGADHVTPVRSVAPPRERNDHHGEDVRELVEDYGCELLYLPTYSPDLNPIEHLFAKLKAFIKSLRPQTLDDLTTAFCGAVKTVSPQNVLNSFNHCGYGVEQ